MVKKPGTPVPCSVYSPPESSLNHALREAGSAIRPTPIRDDDHLLQTDNSLGIECAITLPTEHAYIGKCGYCLFGPWGNRIAVKISTFCLLIRKQSYLLATLYVLKRAENHSRVFFSCDLLRRGKTMIFIPHHNASRVRFFRSIHSFARMTFQIRKHALGCIRNLLL